MEIEKGIPLPPARTGPGAKRRHVFYAMEVGDSVLLSVKNTGAIRAQMHRMRPRKFAARKLSETEMRVWRIA